MNRNEIAAVSVVIPCYRCADTVTRAVNSIVHQTQKPAEVILIDDASGDGTLAVLQALENEYPNWIKVIALAKNSGAASARNAGWAMATQPYIAFLDADDAWHPQKIAVQYDYMQQHPDIVLCGHGRRVLAEKNELPLWQIATPPIAKDINFWPLLLSNPFVTPSVMVRRDISRRFNETQHHMEDHLLWMEIICDDARVVKLSTELAAIYKHPFGQSGLSAQIWQMGANDVANYYRLYVSNSISIYTWLLMSLYVAIKFLRRIFIYWGYVRWK